MEEGSRGGVYRVLDDPSDLLTTGVESGPDSPGLDGPDPLPPNSCRVQDKQPTPDDSVVPSSELVRG